MTRLPVVGSTAASTSFCHERVDGLGGTHIYVDGNGKITAGNGTLAQPRANAFSLLDEATSPADGANCPGSTPTCRQSCYVQNLRKAQPDLYALYAHNSAAIREILNDKLLADDWVMRMATWITLNAAGGFRWHVSGDVFSLEYARWIADVCRESPTVDHWIYTRSFNVLEPLLEVCTLAGGNLAVNLSCDKDNIADARVASFMDGDVPDLRLCYLVADIDEKLPHLGADDVVFPDYALRPRAHATLAESPWWQSITPRERGLVCPVDAHGKAENRRCGPCSRCLT